MSKSLRYTKSTELLERAQKVIPLGSQTFSKSYIQYPVGHAPLYLDKGLNGHVWDVDGNEYVDLVSGLLPVLIGYCNEDVNNAIRRQLDRGITFSLATELEVTLAEKLVEIIPCAEMVRFGKNGSDVTAAAIRLSRAFTGRDHVIALGYHGWQDWYISATVRNKGIPSVTSELTHRLPYNDMSAIEACFAEHPDKIAAIILEPMNIVEPDDDYLKKLTEFAHSKGALVVFDEVITGFRYALGGAQELFGVKPDLACFGKAMANGMPLSAVVGRADIMSEMENIFFSSTFGGECLSIAAALAVIEKIENEPVIETIWQLGEELAQGFNNLVTKHRLENVLSLGGKAPWKIMSVTDQSTSSRFAINTFILKKMLAEGVLINGSHNLCYEHTKEDVSSTLEAYDIVFSELTKHLSNGTLETDLGIDIIYPVFSVR